MVRCRLQPGEGVPRRPFRSAHIGVCDIREAAARERAASAAGNRPLFYFRFGEPCIPERDQPMGKGYLWKSFPSSIGLALKEIEVRFPKTLVLKLRICAHKW